MTASPYDVQYEIYKLLAPGCGVVWDRFFPRPGCLSFNISRLEPDGRIFQGSLVFNIMEIKYHKGDWRRIVELRTRYLMRSLAEATQSTQSADPTNRSKI